MTHLDIICDMQGRHRPNRLRIKALTAQYRAALAEAERNAPKRPAFPKPRITNLLVMRHWQAARLPSYDSDVNFYIALFGAVSLTVILVGLIALMWLR